MAAQWHRNGSAMSGLMPGMRACKRRTISFSSTTVRDGHPDHLGVGSLRDGDHPEHLGVGALQDGAR